jgi:orotidine-5'-phosphate decarboxylase
MLAGAALAKAISPGREPIPLKERLIVALDVPTVEKAKEIVDELGDDGHFYKIGMQLQFAGGLEFAKVLIKEYHKKVFLDSKLLDIGATMTSAVQSIARMGVTFLTVHGNGKTIRAAIQGRTGTSLKILTVTVLTDLDAHDLKDLYGDMDINVEDLVRRRAISAIKAGVDGVIASGQEAAMIREIAGDWIRIVTPGIRPDGTEINDQVRVTTPKQAIVAGADYLVVGRPIIYASDRKGLVRKIVSEISDGLAERSS